MRIHVAVLLAAVAGAAPLLHDGGNAVDVAVEDSADGSPLGPPPVLAGSALPRSPGAVAPGIGCGEYAVRPPLPMMRLVAMDWTLYVVDESGSSVDPKGLISVVISNTEVTKFKSKITGERIVISEVAARDTVQTVRDFPSACPPDILGEDTVEVRASSKRVRVILRGWAPARVVLPEPDPDSATDFFVLAYVDQRDCFRLQASAVQYIPVRFRYELVVAEWFRERCNGEGCLRPQQLRWTTDSSTFTCMTRVR